MQCLVHYRIHLFLWSILKVCFFPQPGGSLSQSPKREEPRHSLSCAKAIGWGCGCEKQCTHIFSKTVVLRAREHYSINLRPSIKVRWSVHLQSRANLSEWKLANRRLSERENAVSIQRSGIYYLNSLLQTKRARTLQLGEYEAEVNFIHKPWFGISWGRWYDPDFLHLLFFTSLLLANSSRGQL